MEKQPKEYGKLSFDQFQQIVRGLPEIRSQMQALPGLIRSAPKAKLNAMLDEGVYWARVYELSFHEQIALLFCALGRTQELSEAAKSDDPSQAALEMFENDEFADWNGGVGGFFSKNDVIGLTVVLQRNILSIMLFHRTLDKLVEDVRAGSDESFFKAVRLDRSIITCPTFALRMARAELENDKAFFLHLRSALKGPSKKHWEAYNDLRYALYMLRELGFDQLSDAQLEDLLVHKLKLYPNVPCARKNLRKQFTESKKFATPSK